MGRVEEARETLARYGAVIKIDQGAAATPSSRKIDTARAGNRLRTARPPALGLSVALTLAALAWGFVNFGVLLWLPASLIAEGRSVGLTSALIARSALIAVPTVAVATYLYSLWSTKRVLILAIGVTVLGLLATLLRNNSALPFLSNPLVSVSLVDRRHQRGDFDSDAVRGGEFSGQAARPRDRLGRGLQQNRRSHGARDWLHWRLVPAFGLAAGAIAIPALASLVLIAALATKPVAATCASWKQRLGQPKLHNPSDARAQTDQNRCRSRMPDQQMRSLLEHALELKRRQRQKDRQAGQHRSESGGCEQRAAPRKQPEDDGRRNGDR